MTAHLPQPRDAYGIEQARLGWFRCQFAHPAEGEQVLLRTITPEGTQLLEGLYEDRHFKSARTGLEVPDDILSQFWFQRKTAA